MGAGAEAGIITKHPVRCDRQVTHSGLPAPGRRAAVGGRRCYHSAVHEAIETEVFRHRVTAVAEAMGATLRRAASSPNIKERADFSCAVFDGRGRMLAQAAHIPVHLGALPTSVAAARHAARTWSPGDIMALNHPFLGGSHLPDITTVSAVFAADAGRPALFLATRAHHADVGGSAPGSMAMAGDLFGEGLVLPPVRLVRGGTADRDLLAVLCANSRTPDERLGDLEAQVAAHRVGEHRLRELLAPSAAAFQRTAAALLAYSERRTRAALAAFPAGTYRFRDLLESDGRGGEDLPIAVAVTLASGGMRVDFSGTAAQVRSGVNMPLAVTRSAVYYVLACLAGDVPVNAGVFRCVRVSAPPGSLVNARPPAAVAAGNVETSQRVVDVLIGALAQASPQTMPAASQGTMNNITIGGLDPRSGRPFTYYETVAGGAGGGPKRSGASAVQVHMTNTRNTPVEAVETSFPVRVERYAVRTGSGGTGLHPGGDGVVRSLRLLVPARITVIAERQRVAPWGLAGGAAGAGGYALLEDQRGPRRLPAKASLDAAAGTILHVATPGGGGWGVASAEQARKQVQDDEQ